jgi:hypothetical protein
LLQIFEVFLLLDNFFQLPGIFQHSQTALGERQYVGNLIGVGVTASRNIRRTQAVQSQIGDEPFLPIVGDQAHSIAANHSMIFQAGRKLLHVLIELGKCGDLKFLIGILVHLCGQIGIIRCSFLE